jgi:Mg2+ and Co2+ transporter CorA
MSEEVIKNYIKDTVYHAVQSTKAENSALFYEIKEQLKGLPNINTELRLINDHMSTIVEQNKIRNGRLEKHEEMLDGLKGWKNLTVGALSIISFIVIPLVVYIFTTKVDKAGYRAMQEQTK